ncbi:MAG TPA: hypothetical protein VGS57_21465 [Thermoanaerobaculia bacterium]|nr:hypothetical protein [Thermoanaerobaculia bacterium]
MAEKTSKARAQAAGASHDATNDPGQVSTNGEPECDRVSVENPEIVGPAGETLVKPLRVETVAPVRVEPIGPVRVSLQRSTTSPSDDQALWVAIRYGTSAIGFAKYQAFLDEVLCTNAETRPAGAFVRAERDRLLAGDRLVHGVDAYKLIKAATEAFLVVNCGIVIPDAAHFDAAGESERLGGADREELATRLNRYLGAGGLPYIDRILGGLSTSDEPPFCALIHGRPIDPCFLELIWSYWNEEGSMVQAINAIALRFQNKRVPVEGNPFANLELHPLRPLSNLLWGYIQDEPFRLTVARRAYEYSHHYGLRLLGKAVPGLQAADDRSKFLEAFHSLLYQVAEFYRQDADTTVIANGFPMLSGLKEVHLLLAEGAHNQFGDLPWTARVEMLIQQWLLSRPEMLEFLRGRAMVPYKESWLGPVDTIRRLFGWGDTPATHFRDLAAFGEQVLLSIRYGDWINVDDEALAKNWARYWKPELQGYIYAYRAVTGVDLTDLVSRQVNAVPPAILLQRRLSAQRTR